MSSSPYAVAPATVQAVATALADVPTAAYSVPHVYPSAAPNFERAPFAPRPYPPSEPVSLYVHLPYCRYRCTFCHFAVRVGASEDAMERYVRGLTQELEWMHPGDGLTQLYIGGGTPTAIPPHLMDQLLGSIFSHTTPSGTHVHTCESSPETISEAHLDVLRAHGVGRVSMGVQSLEDTVLDTVHRDQTERGVLEACELLLGSGLIVNLDLIYGLPGQRHESFVRDFTTLADLGIPSFTVYSLRTSERTPVSRVLGDERFDLASLMEWRAVVQHTAEDLGYTQTRWHTFKRLDTPAGEYERLACFDKTLTGHQLGIGMSARSHLGHTVFRNHSVHDPYLQRIEAHESPVEEVFELDEADRITQFIARSIGDGLHLNRPVYERTFGRPIDADFGELLARLGDADLVGEDGENLVLTDRGKLVYDLVTLSFYPPRARAWLAGLDDRAAFVTIGSPAAADG